MKSATSNFFPKPLASWRILSGWLTTLALLLIAPAAMSAALANPSGLGFTVVSSPLAVTGLWWNENESGWGMSLTQQGPVVFATWYTYDQAGAPTWLVMSSCQVSGASCTGDIYSVEGATPPEAPWNGAGKQVTKVGTGTLGFSDNNTASFNYIVNGTSGTKAISRQIFATGTSAPVPDYSALWWNPAESGWGVALTQQYGMIFATLYVYDAAGKPVWYVASSCAMVGASCSGDLYKVTGGTGPTAPWNGSGKLVTKVGTISFAFSDAGNGTMNYSLNGVDISKTITRQIFYTPPGAAQPYAGTYNGTYSGIDAGTFTVTIGANGTISGNAISTENAPFSFTVTGTISANGTVSMATSGTAGVATFSGSIDANGHLTGTWTVSGQGGGTFSGQKQ